VGAGFSRPARVKRTFREEREYAELPARIEALEAEQQQLRDEVSAPGFYKASPERIRDVLARIEAIGPELEQAMARWIQLGDR
jgi:ATP-binding cassette subfamily F protein uup